MSNLLFFAFACENGSNPYPAVSQNDSDASTLSVVDVSPEDEAADVALNASVGVEFSAEMDPGTLVGGAFTVSEGGTPVDGTVIYANQRAVFWPAAHLSPNTQFTATVTQGATAVSGETLDEAYVWTFSSGTLLDPGQPIDLGTAANFVLLAKSGISTVPNSVIVGDIGVSPAAATYMTGFSLTLDSTNTYARSDQISGRAYAADYADPSPSVMTTAISDMETAFTDGAGRAPDATELGAGAIGGLTLPPGVYRWSTGVLIPSDVTLSGSSSDVWIFQIAQNLTLADAAAVVLVGGALPDNVFWQVSGLVDIGTTAHLQGNVFSQTAIVLRTGARHEGRLLAQTAVDLIQATVIQP